MYLCTTIVKHQLLINRVYYDLHWSSQHIIVRVQLIYVVPTHPPNDLPLLAPTLIETTRPAAIVHRITAAITLQTALKAVPIVLTITAARPPSACQTSHTQRPLLVMVVRLLVSSSCSFLPSSCLVRSWLVRLVVLERVLCFLVGIKVRRRGAGILHT